MFRQQNGGRLSFTLRTTAQNRRRRMAGDAAAEEHAESDGQSGDHSDGCDDGPGVSESQIMQRSLFEEKEPHVSIREPHEPSRLVYRQRCEQFLIVDTLNHRAAFGVVSNAFDQLS